MTNSYPNLPIFLRGDANINPKDIKRRKMFDKLCSDFNMVKIDLHHTTYHHFTGNGSSDSELDVILHNNKADETIVDIICKKNDPLILSHHDIILSRFELPRVSIDSLSHQIQHPQAPRVVNDRVKIYWTQEGIESYLNSVGSSLSELRNRWSDPSEISFSVLLRSTFSLLDMCARTTNDYKHLAANQTQKSLRKPLSIVKSERRLRTCFNHLKRLSADSQEYQYLQQKHLVMKREHKKLIRQFRMADNAHRDALLDSLHPGASPTAAYNALRKANQSNMSLPTSIHTGSKTFHGDSVPDGIFESIKELKTEPVADIYSDDNPDFSAEYQLIVDICRSRSCIPSLSLHETEALLKSLKSSVNDFFSITPLHFLHAGPIGIEHFQFLLNTVIENINLSGLPELNSIYAVVLHKGHGKCKEEARSYRTISTCPLIAKALDKHIRNLSINDWNLCQAPTQYQGQQMSHELACILLTETINHSLYSSRKPIFALFLDARSAFDRVLRKNLIRNMFFSGTNDQRLLYIDNRLSNRQTYCDFNHQLMGPINDTRGLEQGGVFSSDSYKIYNNDQVIISHNSYLGVNLYEQCISCISLADDAVLVSDSLVNLNNLLYLNIQQCRRNDVDLVPEKTKLVAFATHEDAELKYAKLVSPISINGNSVHFSDEAEHLGVIRSSCGSNMPNIMKRMSAHRGKLYSLLPAGLARGHSASPYAILKIERLYALPVLISGLGSLVLSKSEYKVLHDYYKNCLRRILKLPEDTPECFLFLVSGSLPFSALLHCRILSLFNMICNLQNNPLNFIAYNALTRSRPSSKSWFHMVKDLTIQYDLPHPLRLLESPLPKDRFKGLFKSKIHQYWRQYLTIQCSGMTSLRFLQPGFCSLQQPHPMLTYSFGNYVDARALTIQLLLLAGRYRTEKLRRHWSGNKGGFCLYQVCYNLKHIDDEEHFLLHCPALVCERRRLFNKISIYCRDKPVLSDLVCRYLYNADDLLKMQFLLDASTLPDVVSAFQVHGNYILAECFKIGRLWCLSLHNARLREMK